MVQPAWHQKLYSLSADCILSLGPINNFRMNGFLNKLKSSSFFSQYFQGEKNNLVLPCQVKTLSKRNRTFGSIGSEAGIFFFFFLQRPSLSRLETWLFRFLAEILRQTQKNEWVAAVCRWGEEWMRERERDRQTDRQTDRETERVWGKRETEEAATFSFKTERYCALKEMRGREKTECSWEVSERTRECVWVRVRVCVCASVRERERKRERARKQERRKIWSVKDRGISKERLCGWSHEWKTLILWRENKMWKFSAQLIHLA